MMLQHVVKQSAADPCKFTLENKLKGKTTNITMVEGPDGIIDFEGLPNLFKSFIYSFKKEQIKENPLMVLDSAIRSYEAIRSKPGDLLDTMTLSTQADSLKVVEDTGQETFKKEDPSNHYTL